MATDNQSVQTPDSPTTDKQLPTPPPELAEPVGQKSEQLESSSEQTKTTDDVPSSATVSVSDTATTKTDSVEAKAKAEASDSQQEKSQSSEEASSKSVKDEEADEKSEKVEIDKETKSDKKDGEENKDEKADDKEKKEEKKALPRGMKAAVKPLWAKTDAQCKCCTTWVEENPDDGKNVEESDECLQHAIVIRRKKKHEGNRKPLKVDSIVVHSPLIKGVLHRVFSGYPDLVIDLDELIFDAPFAAFFHRWDQFTKAYTEEEDELTKSHLKLLFDALEAELSKPIQRYKDLIRHKAIDFELLWTLYTPGTLMYSHDDGHDRLYETSDNEYFADLSGQKFLVRCDMIDWDGERFGKTTMSETVSKFKGTRQITTLPSYPLQFHAKADEVKRKCIERGRRFEQLAGMNCKDYKGTAIEFTKYSVQTVTSKRRLEGRVMLDEELFSKFNPDEAQTLRELDDDDEDVTKAETEAAERLAEQAKKAKEALQKAEEEQRKKDEEAAKKKDDKSDEKSDTEKSASDKAASEGEKKEEVVETSAAKAGPESKEDTQPTKSEPAVTEENSESPSMNEEKKDETPSSASTDVDGAPTPAESEDAEDAPKSFSNTERQELKEHQLAICNSWLRGYSLTFQKWCSFSVAHISDVNWNDNAFSELVLPSEYRELILATIQSQIRQNQWKQKIEKIEKEQKPWSALTQGEDADEDENPAEFDDFIASKGLGYIMLFSGTPGTGKTSTAECVAELLHVPLCIISVGNLGTTADSVETALQDVLELASKWNAVLLLDEADIFLEQRTKHDIHRNAVVSVFLRLLEYYQGLLVLTTNRCEEIDVAFHSRIHLTLPFPDLNEANREQIWRHFAKLTNKRHENTAMKQKSLPKKEQGTVPEEAHAPAPAPDSEDTTTTTKTTPPPTHTPIKDPHCENLIDLSPTDFKKLSQTQLNGRQIKNAFKTAVLLASYKKEKVQMKHVKTALKTIDGNGLGKREVGGMYY